MGLPEFMARLGKGLGNWVVANSSNAVYTHYPHRHASRAAWKYGKPLADASNGLADFEISQIRG